ncbi:hypothetical protein DFJ73DRAFT_809821 [Zopfochytrium polystomum]|nr:hypothetical protein DFJ73DRAFT_859443 [Zopfochytrium polystomum]KAI9333792.1 hypothetical protein DFJ73DRAFT_853771 [Zopfochytrium polystomum]KAI9364527.1 hypothetical protein DFJ73DRAFT_809821 [Zopfochytrium polystomum]
MRAAMEDLERVDRRLFEGTGAFMSEKAGQGVPLFPRRMRVPTETPPVDGWK